MNLYVILLSYSFRFMTNVWAMFAVVFLAIYTANLAAFMITREEFHEFSGLDDSRVGNIAFSFNTLTTVIILKGKNN